MKVSQLVAAFWSSLLLIIKINIFPTADSFNTANYSLTSLGRSINP